MSPLLLLPAGLAALAALVVPLLLHLARREEDRPLDFAALRWLDQRPRPRSRIRFDERLLLAVRLLLLALLALWLARPALEGAVRGGERTLVIPGADPAGAPEDARWLAPGLPPVTDAVPAGPLPVASLLRQADAELPPGGRLTILAPPLIDGADAERPRLAHPFTWRVVAGRAPIARPFVSPAPRLAIRAAPGQSTAVLRAVARAWQGDGPIDLAPAGAPLPAADRALAWLVPGPLPEAVERRIAAGGTAILGPSVLLGRQEPRLTPDAATGLLPAQEHGKWATVWRDEAGAPLLEASTMGRGRVLRFTRPLTIAALPAAADPDFPQRLRDLVFPPPAPARAFARDYAPLPGGAHYPQPALPLQPWLGVAIAALFLLERWLATRRGRAPSP